MHTQKVVLISGASSGIGKASLKKLVTDGHTVYGGYRKATDKDAIRSLGGIPVKIEMTDESSLQSAVKKVIGTHGKIDVLWNNAGFGLYGPMEEIPLDTARNLFEVNLFGLARLTQLVLPHMRKAKQGLIINTSSMGGKIYFPLGAWYHASKHAVEGWSDCMRLDVKQFGIDVVILEPGFIETNFYEVVRKQLPEKSKTGPYKTIVAALMNAAENGSMKGSSPDVVAEKVAEIVVAENPKTRYLVGNMAKPLVFMRKWLGDRLFDLIILRQYR